jgi:hypothetical protein
LLVIHVCEDCGMMCFAVWTKYLTHPVRIVTSSWL